MVSLNAFFAEADLREFDGEEYVSAARVNDHYRSTQARLVREFGFDYVVVYRRGCHRGEIADVDIDSDDFKPTTMSVYVKSSQVLAQPKLMTLMTPTESDNQQEESANLIAGYYFSDLGNLEDLYDNLSISRDEHSSEKYGSFRVGKYTRTLNMEQLFADSTAGRVMVLNPPQIHGAQCALKTLLKTNNFRRVHGSERSYEIMILFKRTQAQQLQIIFDSVMHSYETRENVLARIINELITGDSYRDNPGGVSRALKFV